MNEKLVPLEGIEIPPGQVIDVTHWKSDGTEYVVGTIERVLHFHYYGPTEEPPEVITFNGKRYLPEA